MSGLIWKHCSLMLLLSACGSARVYQPPPLSAAAMAVRFLPGTQAVSTSLSESCEPVGSVQRLSGETSMRRVAESLGANIVQVVYGSTTTTSDNLTLGYLTFTERSVVTGPSTVRFWRCVE